MIFLKPLSRDLWLTSIALFILTDMALWILEHRFNDAYRRPPGQHAGMIFYVPFMSLVFAYREKIVSNLARLVVVIWMFVVLILSSTYRASLSARFTVQRLSQDANVKELIQTKVYVGCRNGSFILDFSKHLEFPESRIRTCNTSVLCEEALSKGNENGGIKALFSIRPYTNLFLLKYGDKYTTYDEIYPTNGFAYAFPEGLPLVGDVSRKVIDLMDNGKISEIEKKWKINNLAYNDVLDRRSAPTQIKLASFKILFVITGGMTMTCLAVFVITYLYRNRDFVRRIWSSNNTVWSKVAICKHFDERDPRSFRNTADGANVSPSSRPPSTVVPKSIKCSNQLLL